MLRLKVKGNGENGNFGKLTDIDGTQYVATEI
jgi:hypothetical protein